MWLLLDYKACLAIGTWLRQKEMLIPFFIAALTALHHMNCQPSLPLFTRKLLSCFLQVPCSTDTQRGVQFLCTNQPAVKTALGDGYK